MEGQKWHNCVARQVKCKIEAVPCLSEWKSSYVIPFTDHLLVTMIYGFWLQILISVPELSAESTD